MTPRFSKIPELIGYLPAGFLADVNYFSTMLAADSLVELLSIQEPTAYELPAALPELARHFERQMDNDMDGISILWETEEETNAVGWPKTMAPEILFNLYKAAGPYATPYGNGGVRYDDIYMAPGRTLSSPLQ